MNSSVPDIPAAAGKIRNTAVEDPQAVSAWGAASVVGLRRRSNQDRYLRHGATFVVVDGMGGMSGGSEAAGIAVESVVSHIWASQDRVPLTRWESMVRAVNKDVRNTLQKLGFTKAGCTLTLATVEPGRVVVAHVGDSRLYEYEATHGCTAPADV